MADLERVLTKALAFRSLPPPAERKRLRKAHKITDDDLARALGVSRNTVQRWENGDRSPGPRNYFAYVAFLEGLMVIDRGQDVKPD